jgi:hypothetical protein
MLNIHINNIILFRLIYQHERKNVIQSKLYYIYYKNWQLV